MDHPDVYTSLLAHFADYFDAVDRADVDAVMRILDGATLSVAGAETSDPAAIRQAYEAHRHEPEPDGRRRVKHHLTNLRLAGPGPEGAIGVEVYYLRLEPGADGPRVATTGRIRQEVVLDGTARRVRRHEIVTDF